MFDWWRRLRRARILAQPFPEAFREPLLMSGPLARDLEPGPRAKLEALIKIFLAEKNFEGAGGLELTDHMRVVIAARACLMVLHRVELDGPLYPGLSSIIVYPSTYRASERQQMGPVVVEGEQTRLGESWTRGAVVLTWDGVVTGAANPNDGHDVVLHEFAHQLDAEGGVMDGTPLLANGQRYAAWSRIATAEYASLRRAIKRRQKASLDPYGATNAPEFFAVLVEAFFEKPRQLARKHPELYGELEAFFHWDPAADRTGGGPS